jgi:hypothetical protein
MGSPGEGFDAISKIHVGVGNASERLRCTKITDSALEV